MCGRFGLWLEDGFGKRFEIANQDFVVPTSYNIAPGASAAVITHNSPNKVELMRWGLIPPWTKDIRMGLRMINARAEGIATRPAFRSPFKNKRCLIPFNAFYEWKRVGDKKIPYLFKDNKSVFLAFAGLYEIAYDAEGKEIKSFTIITCQANSRMGDIHERMPVILDPEEEKVWLSKETPQDDLLKLLNGYRKKSFIHYPISDQINKAANNSPDLVKPV